MKSPPRPSRQASHLDAIRGVAALFVVLQHARQIFMSSRVLPWDEAFHGFFMKMAGLGEMAVNAFFVLSGFLIASSIRNATAKGRWNWGGYAEARLTRLMVPLVPALLLTAFWDRLGLSLPKNLLYQDAFYGNPPWAVSTLPAFVGNLFFLQNTSVPIFGVNGPLWSLAAEFWYYVTFPMLFFAIAKGRPTFVRIAYGAVAIVILSLLWREIPLRFPQWLCGAAVAFLPHRDWATKGWFRALSVVGLAIAVGSDGLIGSFGVLKTVPYRTFDYLTAVSFGALVWSILCSPTTAPSDGYRRGSSALSDISYTLYLVHFPLIAFLASQYFGNTEARWDETPVHYLALFGIVAICVAYSLIPWYLFERNTPRIRKWITSRWPQRQGVPSSST